MDDKEPHRHDIEKIYWQGGNVHVHEYSTRTSYTHGHTHMVNGTTSATAGGIDQHVHYYAGTTTFEDGHTHRFRGTTGPAVPLPGGGHTHEFTGETSYDHMHTHSYYGRTTRGIQ